MDLAEPLLVNFNLALGWLLKVAGIEHLQQVDSFWLERISLLRLLIVLVYSTRLCLVDAHCEHVIVVGLESLLAGIRRLLERIIFAEHHTRWDVVLCIVISHAGLE